MDLPQTTLKGEPGGCQRRTATYDVDDATVATAVVPRAGPEAVQQAGLSPLLAWTVPSWASKAILPSDIAQPGYHAVGPAGWNLTCSRDSSQRELPGVHCLSMGRLSEYLACHKSD